jgi:hypothetical protein
MAEIATLHPEPRALAGEDPRMSVFTGGHYLQMPLKERQNRASIWRSSPAVHPLPPHPVKNLSKLAWNGAAAN